MKEVRKIPRCRYLNRPSVQSLVDGHRLIELFRRRRRCRIEKESMRRESSIDWRICVNLHLQCWTNQVESVS